METILTMGTIGLVTGILIGAAKTWWRRREAGRRDAARAAYADRERHKRSQQRETRVRLQVARFFPYLDLERIEGEDRRSMLRSVDRTLKTLPGVDLGQTELGVRFRLLEQWRNRHAQIWARSGAGKSVCMTHMILDDLRTGSAAVVIFCPEPEMHTEILGHAGDRDTIYFAAGDPRSTISYSAIRPESDEVGLDRHVAAIFGALKSCLGESKIGPRSDPLLANATALAMLAPNPTLMAIRQVLTDSAFRESLLSRCEDPYLTLFWRDAGESVKTMARPVLSRLDAYLRTTTIRKALCHPTGSFTMREVVEQRKVLAVDTSGLSDEDASLLNSLLTTRLRLELFRREAALGGSPPPVRIYVDEWPAVLGEGSVSEWATLLSRSRKYNCSLVLAGQFPAQVPLAVRRQVAGNVSTCIGLSLGPKDAAALKHELLRPAPDGQVKAIDPTKLVQLPVGTGYVRHGNGACAVRVQFDPPRPAPDEAVVERVRDASWKRYAAPEPADEKTDSELRPGGAPDVAQPPARPLPLPGPAEPAPPPAGRGSIQHKELQALVKKWGESRGFRAHMEHDLLGGATRVDAYLERDGLRLAVEVCLTNTGDEIVRSIITCLSDGIDHVVVVVPDDGLRGQLDADIQSTVLVKDRKRVHVIAPRALPALLDGWSEPSDGDARVAGYQVEVESPPGGRLPHGQVLARLVAQALSERRPC